MSYLLSITLDGLPPTVNQLYRTGGRHRYKTPEGVAYQEATAAEMRAQREMLPARRARGPYLGPVALHEYISVYDLEPAMEACGYYLTIECKDEKTEIMRGAE